MQQQGHDSQQQQDSEAEHIRIGDLLTDAGIVTRGDVLESIQISKRMNLPIGRVLVMSGVLTELLLTAALQVQDLLRDNKLTLNEAYQALNYVHKNQSDLDAAMEALDCKPSTDHSKSKLGLLLVDSDIVTPQQVEEALAASFGSGIPLGSMLVLQGMLSAQLLPGILDAQERLRAGKINHVDAVAEIRTQFDYWAHATDSKSEMLMTLDDQNTPAVSFPTVPTRRVDNSGVAGRDKKKTAKKDGSATGQHAVVKGALEQKSSKSQTTGKGSKTTGSHKVLTSGELAAFSTDEHEAYETGQFTAISSNPPGGVDTGKLSRRQRRLLEKQQGSKKQTPTPDPGAGSARAASHSSSLSSPFSQPASSSSASARTASSSELSGLEGLSGDAGLSPFSVGSSAASRAASGAAAADDDEPRESDAWFSLENNEDLSMLSLLEMGGLTDAHAVQDGIKNAFKDAETTIRLTQMIGLVSRKHAEAAVQCYSLVSQWKLTIPEAVGVLAEMRVTDRPIAEILAKHNLDNGDDD